MNFILYQWNFDTEIYLAHIERESVVAERFIKTLYLLEHDCNVKSM